MLAREDSFIKLEGIRKKFTTDEMEVYALRAIELTVKKGEYLAITGPSGCGKSTLLSIIGLLDTASAGDYYLDGELMNNKSFAELTELRNSYIGFIFQAFNLIGDLTVYENVQLPLIYRNISKNERHERVMTVLEDVGMSHRKHHYPTQLSGGQQQRIAVARALAGMPLILLADEPTGNLDSHNSSQIMALLKSVHESGTTICMVTHDPALTGYAERTIHLTDGSIVDEHTDQNIRRLK